MLTQYEPAFRDNEVDWDVLPDLTAEDLIGLGVTLIGHRRKLLSAIAALGAAAPAPAPTGDASIGAASRTGASPGRAPAADRDVLRPGGVDGALHRDGPRRFARCDRVVSDPLQRGHQAL